jgi:hypothetical protein
MRFLTLSTVALSALGFVQVAQAQSAPKLFIEGDLERGAQRGAPHDPCVLNNRFQHLEKVVWRTRIRDQNGKELDDKDLKSVVVQLPSGLKLEGRYGKHPPANPSDNFWSAAWIIPADYPTGTFAYTVTVTDMQGNTQTWEPFKVKSSQLTILDGAVEVKN